MSGARDYIENSQRALQQPRRALGWIVVTAIIVVCLWIDTDQAGASAAFHFSIPNWGKSLAHLMLIGASTAAFTRFLGGMGLFRDAISDLMVSDNWIDTRNDLPVVWRRVTERLFLPNLRKGPSEAQELLKALDVTLTDIIRKPQTNPNYYIQNAHRTVRFRWKDRPNQIVEVTDTLTCKLIPLDKSRPCDYIFSYRPNTAQKVQDYVFDFSGLRIDDNPIDASNYKPIVTENKVEYNIRLSGDKPHKLERTLSNTQCIETDPIYLVGAGRVVWGFDALLIVDSGIKAHFEEAGIEGAFYPVSNVDPNVRAWHADRVLLPEQGFFVVLADAATRVSGGSTSNRSVEGLFTGDGIPSTVPASLGDNDGG